MEAKMQMLDNYITKYEFKINRKITPKEPFTVDINLVYKILKPQTINNEIIVGIELADELTLKIDDNELGKINVSIFGLFKFNQETKEDEIQKLLKINGVSILYQQLRAYISANTALSQSVPTINLPILNFADKKE